MRTFLGVFAAVALAGLLFLFVAPQVPYVRDFVPWTSNPADTNEAADTVAPDTAITSGTPRSDLRDVVIEFTSTEEKSTFECKLDEGNFLGCYSPWRISALVDGAHTFEVRAIDASTNKNIDQEPAKVAWTTSVPAAPKTADPPKTAEETPPPTDPAPKALEEGVTVVGKSGDKPGLNTESVGLFRMKCGESEVEVQKASETFTRYSLEHFDARFDCSNTPTPPATVEPAPPAAADPATPKATPVDYVLNDNRVYNYIFAPVITSTCPDKDKCCEQDVCEKEIEEDAQFEEYAKVLPKLRVETIDCSDPCGDHRQVEKPRQQKQTKRVQKTRVAIKCYMIVEVWQAELGVHIGIDGTDRWFPGDQTDIVSGSREIRVPCRMVDSNTDLEVCFEGTDESELLAVGGALAWYRENYEAALARGETRIVLNPGSPVGWYPDA